MDAATATRQIEMFGEADAPPAPAVKATKATGKKKQLALNLPPDPPRERRLQLLDLVSEESVFAARQAKSIRGISTGALWNVLRAIEARARSGGGCRAFYETLRGDAKCRTVKTIKRAVAALYALNLITKDPVGRRRGLYIVWSEIEALARKDGPTATGDKKSPIEGDQPGTSCPSSGDFLSSKRDKKSPASEAHEAQRKRPPPPSPIETDRSATWQEAEEAIRALGLNETGKPIRVAQERGETVGQFLALIDLAGKTVGASRNAGLIDSPAGTIYRYLVNRTWPDDRIVPFEQLAEKRRVRDAEDLQRHEQEADRQRQAAADRRAAELLETQYGPALDALNVAQFGQLADKAAAGNEFSLRQMLRNGRLRNSPARLDLLEALAAQAHPP